MCYPPIFSRYLTVDPKYLWFRTPTPWVLVSLHLQGKVMFKWWDKRCKNDGINSNTPTTETSDSRFLRAAERVSADEVNGSWLLWLRTISYSLITILDIYLVCICSVDLMARNNFFISFPVIECVSDNTFLITLLSADEFLNCEWNSLLKNTSCDATFSIGSRNMATTLISEIDPDLKHELYILLTPSDWYLWSSEWANGSDPHLKPWIQKLFGLPLFP